MITHNTLFSSYTLELFRKAGENFSRKISFDSVRIVKEWTQDLSVLPKELRKEDRLESAFKKKILCEALGHVLLGEKSSYSLIPKDHNRQGIPDLKIGSFTTGHTYTKSMPTMLLELKGPDCLDFRAPQTSRPDRRSPLDQVVSDMFNEDEQCEFALVSNFLNFELVSRRFASKRSIVFTLEKVNSLNDIQLLLGLIGIESPLVKGDKIALEFKSQDKEVQRISKNFFTIFRDVRQTLLEESSKFLDDNKVNRLCTKILSQIIFVQYGETIGILPKRFLLSSLESSSFAWNTYRKFCSGMDRGSPMGGLNLFGYNGGLFANDPDFGKKFSSDLLKIVVPLLQFSFEDKDGNLLSVNAIRDILGCVLEHALDTNEEERIFNFTKEGKFADARKKQATKTENQAKGVFYTPQFVTNYMVRRVMEMLKSSGSNISKTVWLDPTCGSGAFLNEVFDQLTEYELSKIGLRRDMLGRRPEFDEIQSKIQQDVIDRIHGLDFDPMAIGISQLNLSLRCFKPDEKLPSLGNTIQERDSLLRPFEKEVDVVIANPPYMQWRYIPPKYREWLQNHPDYRNLSQDSADYSAFFFNIAAKNLKPNGILAFIATNKLLATYQGESFRKWLLRNFDIIEILDFRKKIFQKTDVETAIYILRKKADMNVQESYSYRDIYSFLRSEQHLEIKKFNMVNVSYVANSPYYTIPTRTTPALLKTFDWFNNVHLQFSSIGADLLSKSGLRITDINSADVLQKSPPKSVIEKYEPLYDGPCLEPNSRKINSPMRWVAKNSERVSSWRQELGKRAWFVIIKEKSVRPAAVSIKQHCPAILNSLNIIYPTNKLDKLKGEDLAYWLTSPFATIWIEFWFGANRTHSNQRWKDIYFKTIPLPKDRNQLRTIVPNWVEKEFILYLDGDFRGEISAETTAA